MAKRSPIAGYNHNVRYRGLIFHVQTEDSGLASPHLFTHMFHGGVIISTRKLVYDAGSAEDAIKGLMQSQHKVVLRDLKRGLFDDKIDQYLAGTEGLLPRGAGDEPRDSSPVLPVQESEPEITLERSERSETEHDLGPEMGAHDDEAPSVPQPILPRTRTAERKSGPGQARGAASPPPPADLDPPTLTDSSATIAAAVAANATVRTAMQDSGPLIKIELEQEDDQSELPRRAGRDTFVESRADARAPVYSDGVPGQIGASPSGRTGADSIQSRCRHRPIVGPAPPWEPRPCRRRVQSPGPPRVRPSNHRSRVRRRTTTPAGAATATRPSSTHHHRRRAIRRIVPEASSQHRREGTRPPVDVIKTDRSGAIPSGLAHPGRPSQTPANVPGSGGIPQRTANIQTQPMPAPPVSRTSTADSLRNAPRPRTPTPARVSASGPATSRVPTSSSGGVVMTRPAVIVGAPAKVATPKVRKAREEEGRGFGHGLISEKSLDEVILAYLSEDADEK